MKSTAIELALNRWPYALELQPSANGQPLRPSRKARVNWSKMFCRLRSSSDDLASTLQITNEFDAKEWQW